MSKSDTDSNSESFKSLSDEENTMSKPIGAENDEDSTNTASEVESSDDTVDNTHISKEKLRFAETTSARTLMEEADKNENAAMAEKSKEPPTQEEKEDEKPTGIGLVQAISELSTAEDLLKGADGDGNSNGLQQNANFTANRMKYSRGEKKARRLLIKQGAKPLPNISRVVMRQGAVLFVIENAEIYKNPRSDTFIVFGEVRMEDLAKQQEDLLTCHQLKAAQKIVEATKTKHDKIKPNLLGTIDEEGEEGEALDETGIDPADINMVMTQASATRARAVRALKENNNDIVNAIMELTM